MNAGRYWLSAVLLVGAGGGCGGGSATRIIAGGATFVEPLMQVWSGEYLRLTGMQLDYVAQGSGYGIEQTLRRTIDFGCSDLPLNKEQLEKSGSEIIHLPLTAGAVAVVYNVPGVSQPLKLTGELLADIYRRDPSIQRWNASRIAELNPGVTLPALDIVVVARADKSGTTMIFSEYLAKVSPKFDQEIGRDAKPKWPRGVVGQEKNDGVAGFVKATPGTIGYVEALFAKRNQLATAQLQNRSGMFVNPDISGVQAAAMEAMKTKPTEEPYCLHELTYSLTNPEGPSSYPICGFSYAILWLKLPKGKGPAIVDFLKWATQNGQKFCADLEYAPLPAELQQAVSRQLERITFE